MRKTKRILFLLAFVSVVVAIMVVCTSAYVRILTITPTSSLYPFNNVADQARCFYALQDCGFITVGGQRMKMEKGAALIIFPGVEYTVELPEEQVTYIAVNFDYMSNKPVLFVYLPSRLLEAMGGPEAQKKAFDACREYAVKVGFDGMTFATFNYDISDAGMKTDYDSGYDFRFCYHSGYHPPYDFPPQQDVIDGQLDVLRRKLAQDPMGFVPTPSCFLDTTPRRSQRWIDMGYNYKNAYNCCYKLDAENYRIILRNMKKMTDALPDGAWGKKIFMIDNWNEWDEGHYVAPSHEFGFKYLQAIREELTFRDNLPDYRMPQDIGLSNFNKSWGSPDLSDNCRKKFGVDYD